MQNSSAFCRKQEAHHRQRAAETSLANVRSIATSAAQAWGLEAVSAERREERQIKRDGEATALHAAADARGLSENPDRGFAETF